VLYTIVVHNDMDTHEQLLKMSVGLGLVFVDYFRFSILCFSGDYFVLVLFAFVVLGLVSSCNMPRDWLGRTSPI